MRPLRILLTIPCLMMLQAVTAQNVGIGEALPTAKLTIVGADATPNGQGAAIRLRNLAASAGNSWYIRAGAAGTTTPDNGLSIADNAGYRLVINGQGQVGIGETAPNALLHLQGGQWDLSATEGDFKIGNNNHRLKMGVALSGGGSGNAFIRAQGTGGTPGALTLGAGNFGSALTVLGNNGNVVVHNRLNRDAADPAHLLPIAYGYVNGSADPPVILSGTNNFTVTRISQGLFNIQIAGESFQPGVHIAFGQVHGNTAGSIILYSNTFISPTGMLVLVRDIFTNTPMDQPFAFIVYKPAK